MASSSSRCTTRNRHGIDCLVRRVRVAWTKGWSCSTRVLQGEQQFRSLDLCLRSRGVRVLRSTSFNSTLTFFRWIFFSAVNSVTTQIILNLGFENSAWRISIRQLSFNLCNLFASVPIIWWATKRKDIKTPLYVTFVLFLIT